MGVSMQSEVTLREIIEQEAKAAGEAVPALRDDLVSEALRQAGALRARAARRSSRRQCGRRRRRERTDVDEGTLDRLRLDDARVEGLARQLEAMAGVEPLEREAGSWTLPNGLRVSERRIPIGSRRGELRGAAERRARRRRPAPQEPERSRPAHRRGRARDGDGARRRRAPARTRGSRPPARRGRARPLTRSRGRAPARLHAQARPARDPPRERRDDGERSPGSPPRTACARSRTPRVEACSTCTRRPRGSGRSRSRRRASTGSASATA